MSGIEPAVNMGGLVQSMTACSGGMANLRCILRPVRDSMLRSPAMISRPLHLKRCERTLVVFQTWVVKLCPWSKCCTEKSSSTIPCCATSPHCIYNMTIGYWRPRWKQGAGPFVLKNKSFSLLRYESLGRSIMTKFCVKMSNELLKRWILRESCLEERMVGES